MKRCDHFKDLILTGYMDGELAKDSAKAVEDHLLDCADCRVFFKEVKHAAIMPFQNMQQPVPAELWTAIKEQVEHKQAAPSPLADLAERLKSWLAFPRMVPVFASLVAMLIVGSVTVNTIQVQQAQEKDQGEYLVSLLGPTGPSAASDAGTPIEHYFL